MSINQERLRQFRDTYSKCLTEAVEKYPDEYVWRQSLTIEKVVDSMVMAVERGSYNKEGRAMKTTFKLLGLAYTYRALDSWLRG